jgi:aminoglycoside 6'-N-acetyltransferase I
MITQASEDHIEEFLPMALDLWPEESYEGLKPVFTDILRSEKNRILFFREHGKPIAFIYLSIRVDYVEGSDSSPAGYVEGIYVKHEFRRKGISLQLLKKGEEWLKGKGCKQIGSDIYIDNKVSYDFHTSVGFKEAGRLIAFIKDL